MIFKAYYFRLVAGTILIVLTSIFAGIQISNGDKPFTIIVVTSLLIIQICLIIHENNRINIQLKKFFDAFRNNDNTVALQHKYGSKSFAELTRSMNETLAILKDARFEKEKQFRFLKFMSDQLGIGLLVLDRHDNTVLFNNAIAQELNIDEPANLMIIGSKFPELQSFLGNLKNGQTKVFRSPCQGRNILLVRASYFTPGDQSLRLFIFQDLKRELEDTEIETWHKMIRILSHEIMNSVTPVINLASASRKSLERIKSTDSFKNEVVAELNDIIINNEIVEERMKGLSEFVIKYKNASSIPAPETSMLNVTELVSGIVALMRKEIENQKIHVKIIIQDTLTINGDKNLIGQVLINLVRNSIEASENSEQKEIIIEGKAAESGINISVTDKGEGIPKENLDRIFLPFFTTRKNGSGIGLSLSKQIIRMHGGTLSIWSETGKGTRVEILI